MNKRVLVSLLAAVTVGVAAVDDLGKIVGRAWESSEEAGVKQVNVVVGLETHAELGYIHKQDNRIAQLEQQLSEKTAWYEQQLVEKTVQIERLAARIEQMDQRMAALAAQKFVALKR